MRTSNNAARAGTADRAVFIYSTLPPARTSFLLERSDRTPTHIVLAGFDPASFYPRRPETASSQVRGRDVRASSRIAGGHPASRVRVELIPVGGEFTDSCRNPHPYLPSASAAMIASAAACMNLWSIRNAHGFAPSMAQHSSSLLRENTWRLANAKGEKTTFLVPNW